MQNEYQETPEEVACDKLLAEADERLSGPALYILKGIHKRAFEVSLARNPTFCDEEMGLAWQSWRSAANKLTVKDFELLIDIRNAAEAAANSIDPYNPTPIAYKVPRGDLSSYFNWIYTSIEEILDEAFESRGYRINKSSKIQPSH